MAFIQWETKTGEKSLHIGDTPTEEDTAIFDLSRYPETCHANITREAAIEVIENLSATFGLGYWQHNIVRDEIVVHHFHYFNGPES